MSDTNVVLSKAEETNQSIADAAANTEMVIQESSYPTYDLGEGDLPNLAEAEEVNLDLMSDYWTPEAEGENKRVFFDKIEMCTVKDSNTQEEKELECAYFLEQTPDRTWIRIRNGSKRLVAAFKENFIQRGTPWSITYMGKRKNVTNTNKSDYWSIKPLQIQI